MPLHNKFWFFDFSIIVNRSTAQNQHGFPFYDFLILLHLVDIAVINSKIDANTDTKYYLIKYKIKKLGPGDIDIPPISFNLISLPYPKG
jgi:hypothetical protein